MEIATSLVHGSIQPRGDNSSLSFFFHQECQKKLEHKLGLDSYLLKPVQRITKYQLLLKVQYYLLTLNLSVGSLFFTHFCKLYAYCAPDYRKC